MRRAAWSWACLCVLYFGCGDDAKQAPRAGGSGDAGEGHGMAGEGVGAAQGSGGSDETGAGQPGATAGDGNLAGAGGTAGAGGEGDLPTFESGTRLRAILQGAGDARSLFNWHDSELDIDCTFRKAEDGVMRCLPQAFVVGYSDDECQSALVSTLSGCAVPKYAIANGPACGDGALAYE